MTKLRPLTGDLLQMTITELNEDPDQTDEEIQFISELISIQPGVGKYQLSDQFIVSFLRSCKYNRSIVKKKLPNYITMRKISPDIFANRIVNEQMIDILRKKVHLPLPMLADAASPMIHISNYGNLNLNMYSIYEGIKLFYMMLEIRFLEDDRASIAGFRCIEDFSNLTFSHMVTMNIGVLKKIMGWVRSGIPYRLKGIHIINAPWFVNGIMGLFRDALPLKMKKRFFIHKKLADLYEHVPRELLPKEYGGDNSSVEDIVKSWEKKMRQYQEYFELDFKFGVESEPGNGLNTQEALFCL